MKKGIFIIIALLSFISVKLVASDSILSVEQFYNLGNEAFEEGDYANAVYNYEKALLLNPNFNDARHNLALTKQKLPVDIVELEPFFLAQWWQTFRDTLLPSGWMLVSIILLISLFVILYLRKLGSLQSKAVNQFVNNKVAISLIGLFFLVTIFAGMSRSSSLSNAKYGIIMGEVSHLKEGPDDVSKDTKVVCPGIKVEYIDSYENWMEVLTMDKDHGWIKKEEVKMLSF